MPSASPPNAPAAPAAPAPLQVFRPGRHTAMSGTTLAFSESDLAATAQAYDPAKHEAPIVVGHPTHDGPAYGWVKSLAHAGGALEAQPHQVDAAFAELVGAGRFKKISASFYAPDAPANPVPGVYYLRHVGFLGAMAPAVKGLRTPAFAENEPGVVEFSEWDDATNANLWRTLREWFIGKFGLAEADQVIPAYQVRDLELGAHDEARDAAVATGPSQAQFSEALPPDQEHATVTPEQAAALQAENARLQGELAAAQTAQRATRDAAVRAEQTAFCERLVTEGRISADAAKVWALELGNVATADTPVHFGEGATQRPLLDAMREQLAALPPRVEFTELATAGRAAGDGSTLGNREVADRASAWRTKREAAGQTLSFTEAVDAVRAGKDQE